MELVILLVVIVGVLGWFLWKDRNFESSGSHAPDNSTKVLDINNDGKVDLKDAVAAAEVVVEKTKKTAVKTKAVAKATVSKVKTAATKKIAAVKKPVAKKPVAKKPKK